MEEASPIKFYVAKYVLLVIALIAWSAGAVLLYLNEFTLPNLALEGLFILVGVFLVIAFIKFNKKLKRVVVGPNKFVVMENHSNVRFEWPEVKSFRIVPILNLCKVKVRGRRGSFYFFFTGSIRTALEHVSNRLEERKKKHMEPNEASAA